MRDEQRRRVAAEYRARKERERRFDVELGSYDKQREFILDESPVVLACTTRRAGKSFGLAWKLLRAARKHPRSIVPYITQAREVAKDIIWPAFYSLNDRYDLGLRFRENNGDVLLPNGSKIILRGAGSKREVEKLRGMKFPTVVIDEAQGFTSLLKYLYEDVVEPATLDYGDAGQVCFTGTPNAACAGPFYDMIHSGNYPVHAWTLHDNPYLHDTQEWLKRKRERSGWDINNPTYLREYCGVWIRDAQGLVFRFSDDLNLVTDFPLGDADDWAYTLGIDLGFNDPTAFVVLGYSQFLGRTYVVESYQEAELIPSAVAAHVKRLDERYHFARMVADSGGYGKGIVEELNQKHHLDVQPAQKKKKAAYIEMLNGDLSSGVLRVVNRPNTELVEEIKLLQWDMDQMDRNKLVVDDKRFADHLSDALLYAWRECSPHDDDWEEDEPKVGSPEYWEKVEERYVESRERQLLQKEEDREWFD